MTTTTIMTMTITGVANDYDDIHNDNNDDNSDDVMTDVILQFVNCRVLLIAVDCLLCSGCCCC